MTKSEEVIHDLVRLRKRHHVRQMELAEAMGVTQSRISQIERMRGPIPFDLVIAYATVLGAKVAIVPGD